MRIRSRIYLVLGLALLLAVLGVATWGSAHSTASGAFFLFAVATVFILVVLGIPSVIVVTVSAASRKQGRYYSARVSGGATVGFRSMWTPRLSRQLQSTGRDVPSAFRNRVFSKSIFVETTPTGIRLSRNNDNYFEIWWTQIAEVSYGESELREVSFPMVIVSVFRPGGSVDMRFRAARADPAGARKIAREFQGCCTQFSTAATP
jgi:hypothetical protein